MQSNNRIFIGLGCLAVAPWLIGASVASPVEDNRTVITVTGKAEQPRQPPFVVLSAGVERMVARRQRRCATMPRPSRAFGPCSGG